MDSTMESQMKEENKDIITVSIFRYSPQYYKALIVEAWQKSFEDVLRVGRLLDQAKRKLCKKDWKGLITKGLPFGPTAVCRFINVAKDKRITDLAHVQLMPQSYGTLYELHLLSDEEFNKAIETGLITPTVMRKQIIDFKNQERGRVSKTKVNKHLGRNFATVYVELEKADPSEIFEKLEAIREGTEGVQIEYTKLIESWQRKQLPNPKLFDYDILARKELNKFVSTKRKELTKKRGKRFKDIGWPEIDEMLEARVKGLSSKGIEFYVKAFDLTNEIQSALRKNQECY